MVPRGCDVLASGETGDERRCSSGGRTNFGFPSSETYRRTFSGTEGRSKTRPPISSGKLGRDGGGKRADTLIYRTNRRRNTRRVYITRKRIGRTTL